MSRFDSLQCPIPIADYPIVLLAHGGGGRLMHELIERIFRAAFHNPLLDTQHDGALLPLDGERLAFTTDSFVVHPHRFPGGDIGTLAVYGTVNDLLMCGARPRYLSLGFILEEGLPMETLWQVVCSMRDAAERAQVQIVTGDTKVVDRGKGDGIFINSAAIGTVAPGLQIGPTSVRPGDVAILSGDVGRHGMAVMAVREGLEFESAIESDCAPLTAPVMALLEGGVEVHCLRDLTRGGLASALIEIAMARQLTVQIEERAIPVDGEVRAACEILGLDPLYVANEGRFVAFVAAQDAARALALLQRQPLAANAAIIGEVTAEPQGLVTMRSVIGVNRILSLLSGEQLPRIC
ncbi:MAG: hydrogenase expression/formation protein HypE [Anaerolineales bacterium]|nr:hydrogenase expression/formation protein HypE [Anaerolineales bacterium]MCB9128436.1 hydrogenase expression/formation protein HypE [Ardenticatenales bacterium]